MHRSTKIVAVLLLLFLPYSSNASDEKTPELKLKDAGCIGKCICVGNESAFHKAKFNENGPQLFALKMGITCLATDFTGDSIKDFVIPGAEGMATVVVNSRYGDFSAFPIDAGGVVEIYDSSKSKKLRNPPTNKFPGIFIEWVGQKHAIFFWDGKRFRRDLFDPSR